MRSAVSSLRFPTEPDFRMRAARAPGAAAAPGFAVVLERGGAKKAGGGARRRKALEILAVWSLVGVFIAAQRYLRGPSLQPRLALPWGESLAASLVTAYFWALLTPIVMRFARRLRPVRGAAAGRTVLLVLAAAGAAFAHLLLTNLFWHLLDPGEGTREFAAMLLATLAFGGTARIATCFAIVGVTWVIDDYRTYRVKEIQASEIERELVQTELEALKLRLHPSFLFNTLSALQPLIRTDPRAAARVVVQLGDVLRLALYDDPKRLVTLKNEIDTTRLYLQIERARLRDRLDVEFAIAPETLPAAVPSLVLMPLIESAVANGVERRTGRSLVSVQSETRGDVLTLRVAARGAGAASCRDRAPIDPSFVEKARRRMELLYPEAHSLTVEDSDSGHCVSLAMPFTEETGARLLAEARA